MTSWPQSSSPHDPIYPIPVRITRPRQARMALTNREKFSSSSSRTFCKDSISISKTLRASAIRIQIRHSLLASIFNILINILNHLEKFFQTHPVSPCLVRRIKPGRARDGSLKTSRRCLRLRPPATDIYVFPVSATGGPLSAGFLHAMRPVKDHRIPDFLQFNQTGHIYN